MTATEVVRVTSVARNHARGSLDRLERHIAKGSVKGVAQEVKFLNALDRNARLQASRAAGVSVPRINKGLGERALAAYTGGTGNPRYIRSSVLADFSEDVMAPARVQDGGIWVWTANESACAACLMEHGRQFPAAAFFSPMHKSCMCLPDTPGLATPLTDAQLANQLNKRGGRDARLANQFLNGEIPRSGLRNRLPNGDWVQRNTVTGKQLKKPAHKWTKDEIQVLDDLGPAAKKPQVVQAFRAKYPGFQGSDQSIWAKHQRVHDLLGKKKKVTGPKTATPSPSPQTSGFKPPQGVQVKQVDTWVADNIRREQLWNNGTSVYNGTYPNAQAFRQALQKRYGNANIKVVEIAKGSGGKYRAVVRHLDVEKSIKQGQSGKLWQGKGSGPKVASQPKTVIPKPKPKPTPEPVKVTPEVPANYAKKKVYKGSQYADEADGPVLELAGDTKVKLIGEAGKPIELTDDVYKLLDDIDANFLIKNKAVKNVQFQYGPIADAPGAAGYYKNGTIYIRLDGAYAQQARHTLAHELTHGFIQSKPGQASYQKFKTQFDDWMRNWNTLDDESRAALQYARSKYATNPSLAAEEGFADMWAMYLNGEKALIKRLGLTDDFADAARRLSYVPIKKRAKKAVGEWYWKPGEARTGTPYFQKLEARMRQWQNTLTAAERQAVQTYTGAGASQWNSALGAGRTPVGEGWRHLQNALKRAAKYNDDWAYTWRVLPSGSRQFVADMEAAFRSGGTVTHKPFASSTTKPGSYGSLRHNTVLEMKTKSGAWVRPISRYSSENEWLIASNLRYNVIGKEVTTVGRVQTTVWKLEEVI